MDEESYNKGWKDAFEYRRDYIDAHRGEPAWEFLLWTVSAFLAIPLFVSIFLSYETVIWANAIPALTFIVLSIPAGIWLMKRNIRKDKERIDAFKEKWK